jgi:DNA invertase Pin-like site-specific DNA recombinase
VGIYARYSSENQRDASIEDQVRICRARAEREGWAVTEVFTDFALSGSSLLRPGYQALLAALRAGQIDVVLSESLDRLSRDQEHVAGFHKAAIFAGVRIVTLAEGEVSELHVGLKGTMGALYLKDLADKTRRGLEGRVRAGRSGGGLCYGYRVVRGPVGRDGEAERGLREIEPEQAKIVQRIFEEFAAGVGPIAIAKRLNAEGIAGPRGGAWSDGALRGQAARETGILRNELYAGRLVWNRRRWIKDPSTGRRVARQNSEATLVTEEVPELRIIPADLWQAVQQRLAAAARPQCSPLARGTTPPDHLWHYRRAPTLLSGKVVCGACGGSFITSGRDYMACKAMVRQGTCGNKVRLRRGKLEVQVLGALAHDLMRPELVAEFVAAFTAEWNRLAKAATTGAVDKQRDLDGVERKVSGLIDAIADGLRAQGLQDKLDELERRKVALELELAQASHVQTLPRLHPNLAEVYRARVSSLREAMSDSKGGAEVMEAARALIDRLEVHPQAETGGAPRLELIGHLSAMLRAGGFARPTIAQNGKSPSAVADGLRVFASLQS